MIEQSFKQVVGARYVPKFYQNSQDPSSSEWEAGKMYEPLTNVTYNMDGYVSKVPVPMSVGNPHDNPTYWAKTFDYNAAYQGLQNEIDVINNHIDSIDGEIGDSSFLTENATLNDAIYKNNAIANSGVGVSKFIKFITPAYAYFRTLADIAGDSDETYNSLQGVGYDSKRDTFIIGVTNSSDSTIGLLATVDANDFTTVISRSTFSDSELGHCNNVVYNSKSDKIAILCANTRVAMVNPTNLAIIEQITLDYTHDVTGDLITQLTYAEDEDCYYALSQNGIYKFNADFTLSSYTLFDVPYNELFNVPSYYEHDSNGFMYKDGMLYIVNEWHHLATRQNFVLVVDKNVKVVRCSQIDPMSHRVETEAIVNYKGNICVFAQFMMFSVYQIDFAPQIGLDSIETMLNGGIAGEAGLDADVDFFPTGMYSFTKSISKQIDNVPCYSDMGIITIPIGGVLWQFAVCATSGNMTLFKRSYNQSNRAWRAWSISKAVNYFVQKEDGKYTVNNVVFNGFITQGSRVRLLIPNYAFASTNDANAATAKFTGYITKADGTLLDFSSTPITSMTCGSYGNALWVQDNTNSYTGDEGKNVTFHGNFEISFPVT